jgi:hypothetical protein
MEGKHTIYFYNEPLFTPWFYQFTIVKIGWLLLINWAQKINYPLAALFLLYIQNEIRLGSL